MALTAKQIEANRAPGSLSDGGGLVLRTSKSGDKLVRRWLYRYRDGERVRDMGLGGYPEVSLAAARAAAASVRDKRRQGVNPIEERKETRKAIRAEKLKSVTFRKAAEKYIELHEPTWKNAKHAAQWSSTLESYVYPKIGALSVCEIDTTHILSILEPIWTTKAETASRVRARIEVILDSAKAAGQRSGDNPAKWRGHLDRSLPRRNKAKTVKHHAALPHGQMPGFMADLRLREGSAARCLEFAILAACRSGEARGATWGEIDTTKAVWTIPASRMKAGREHRVPLSARALEIIETFRPASSGAADAHVFPGQVHRKCLSDMALLAVVKRMGLAITPHGTARSAFRDWCSEVAHAPRELAESCLAHAVASATEAAYFRSDLFDRRRELMDRWAAYCMGVAQPTEKAAA